MHSWPRCMSEAFRAFSLPKFPAFLQLNAIGPLFRRHSLLRYAKRHRRDAIVAMMIEARWLNAKGCLNAMEDDQQPMESRFGGSAFRRSGFDNAIRSAMNFFGLPKPWTWDCLVCYLHSPRFSSSFDMDFSSTRQ